MVLRYTRTRLTDLIMFQKDDALIVQRRQKDNICGNFKPIQTNRFDFFEPDGETKAHKTFNELESMFFSENELSC